jgi:hypothetical protein
LFFVLFFILRVLLFQYFKHELSFLFVTFLTFSLFHALFSAIQHSPQGFDSLPLTAPMLAVGAYSTTNASGVLALFDKNGVGSLYMASSVFHDPATNAPLSWLFAGPKRPIDNGGAILTPNAIAISARGVAYILDQVKKNKLVP